MGFIAKIKKLFSKKIDTADISDDNIISLVLNQSIKYGRTLEVKPGSVAVFVAKGKVADVFNEGIHRLELGYIPILSRILKLVRPDKNGNLPNRFCAELYLVNLKQFENQKFASADSVRIKDKKYKNLNVKLQGEYSFEIFNPVEFLEALLTQYGMLKNSIAKEEISSWIAELAVKKVQKNNPSVEQLHARATECFEGLIDDVNKELNDCGVKVNFIEVTNTVFPKKIFKSVKLDYTEFEQNKSAKNNDKTQIENNQYTNNQYNDYVLNNQNNYTLNNPNFNNQNYQTDNYNNYQSNYNNNNYQQSYNNNNYQQNYNNNINRFDINENYYNGNNDYNDNQSYHDSNNDNVKNNNYDYQKSDLQSPSNSRENIEPEITKTVGYKICLNCGAYNSSKSEHCFNCKSKI